MTMHVDRFWVNLGVDADELQALKARGFAYFGLAAMAGLSICLLAGIASNLVG